MLHCSTVMCKPGYFGEFCGTTCPPGSFGPECGGFCHPNCSNDMCDHVHGCLEQPVSIPLTTISGIYIKRHRHKNEVY